MLIEHPAYEPMVAAARFLGAEVKHFARRGPTFALDPEAVEAALTPRTRLIVLTNLHNPTGNLADTETLRAIGALAERWARTCWSTRSISTPRSRRSDRRPARRRASSAPSSLTKVYGLSRPALRLDSRRAGRSPSGSGGSTNCSASPRRHASRAARRCIALDRLDEVAADTPALLARNRALANAFFAGRDDLEVAPMIHGITASRACSSGDVDALNDRLRADYDTSIVPGRFFGLADHFRIGVGQPTRDRRSGAGTARRARWMSCA